MTRIGATSSLIDQAQIDTVIERSNVTRNVATGSFLALLTAEAGALVLVVLITLALLALV